MKNIKAYAQRILKEHGCDEHSYWGTDGKTIVNDLKEAYPNGMEFPYVDVANAILVLSKPKLIVRKPYMMVFNTESCTDGIEFDSLEAAKNDALDTLILWMTEIRQENKISSNDLSTWSEKAKEDWDYMIYNCSVEVRKYDPKTDEYDFYEPIWEPSYEDEEVVGWIPTDEVERWNRVYGIEKGADK